MKKLFTFAIVLVMFIAVGFGAYFFLIKNSTTKFTLVKEEGNIYYRSSDSTQYIELLDEEIQLANGSYVKTDIDSYARVFLPDNSLISLDASTEVQINFEDNKVDIQQFIGKTWNRVQTVTNGGEFKIETPNTIAAVRGTIFGVGVENDNHSRVFVEESVVNIGKYEKSEGNKSILENIDLGEGELANIIRDASSFRIIKEGITEEFKQTLWYRRNKIMDEEYNKIKDLRNVNLRNLLQQKLQLRPDYFDLRLGLRPVQTDPKSIQEELAEVYRLSNIDESTCVKNSSLQIQDAIDQLKRYRTYVNNSTEVIALLDSLKRACSDGQLDLDEAELLQKLVNAANE